jgi:hypothetical protein
MSRNNTKWADALRLTAFTAVVSGLALAAAAAAPPSSAVSAVDLEDPLVQDAAMYAETYGVTLEEAVRRFDLQTKVGELDAALTENETETFAGLWIEHRPTFRVVARFTQGGKETVRHYVPAELQGLVDVRGARATLAQLEAEVEAAGSVTRGVGVHADADVNLARNRAEVYVTSRGALDAALQRNRVGLPVDVVVEETAELAVLDANIYAGLALTTCTSGYSVRHNDGRTGITTAAHCGNTQRRSGTLLPWQGSRYGGSYDVQWHTTPGFTDRPWARDGLSDSTTPGYRIITSRTSRLNQPVGGAVCKFGMTTGRTCGSISSRSYNPGLVPSSNATWVRVEGGSTNLSSGGDSGGPWYFGGSAYGIHHCGIGNDACYMAVNFIGSAGLGLTVRTG